MAKTTAANGHDTNAAILEALHTIHADLVQTNQRIDTMRTDLTSRIDTLTVRMEGGFEQLGNRIDNILQGVVG